MTARRLVLSLAVLATAALGGAWALRGDGRETLRQTRIDLPDVQLIDRRDRAFRLHEALEEDALTIINFSYTTCESICPLGNQVLQFVDERRGEIARPVHLVTVTIDPQHDTPAMMRKSAEAFGASANWHWLTGQPAAIDALLRAAGANVADIQLHDPVFLVGEVRSGRFFRSLSMPDADELIAMLRHFDT